VFDGQSGQPISLVADTEEYRRVFDAALHGEQAPRSSLLARLSAALDDRAWWRAMSTQ